MPTLLPNPIVYTFSFIPLIFRIASSKSPIVVDMIAESWSASSPVFFTYSLMDAIAAPLATAAKSAPVKPSVISASLARSTSLASGFFFV